MRTVAHAFFKYVGYNELIKQFCLSSFFQFLKIFQRVSTESSYIHQLSPISIFIQGFSIPQIRKIGIVNRCKDVRSIFNLRWYSTPSKWNRLISFSLQLDLKDVFFYYLSELLERIMLLIKWKVIPTGKRFCKNEFSPMACTHETFVLRNPLLRTKGKFVSCRDFFREYCQNLFFHENIIQQMTSSKQIFNKKVFFILNSKIPRHFQFWIFIISSINSGVYS